MLPQPSPPVEGEPFRFFSPSSFWNTPVATDAVLDPHSGEIVNAFSAEINRLQANRQGPWINATNYSVPIYTVPADQPTVRVQLLNSTAPALQAAWGSVPIPPSAQPSEGTDSTLVVWQPSNDRLWEFWRMTQSPGGWQASWGGAMQSVSSNLGAYDSSAWPGAKSWWGSSASSLSIAGGLITLEDLSYGEINHALSLAIPTVRAGVYVSPAKRSDGTSLDPLALPEGAQLRLDPTLDLAALQLPRLTLMIAEAAQRYGIFIRDRSAVVHFFAEDPVSLATNPYTGPSGYFEGKTPAQLLSLFPWSHLQVLKMNTFTKS